MMRYTSLGLFIGWVTSAALAQPITLGISPLRAELKAQPGAETSQPVRISNSGEEPVQIRATISDWTLTASGETQFVKPGATTWACAQWLKINPTEFTVEPGGSQLVRYTMKVPGAAAPGGYHCAILFDTVPPPKEKISGQTGVVNLIRMVTTLYAALGDPPIVAKIRRLEIEPQSREKKKSGYDVVTEFGNDGTTHYRVNGDLEIHDADGRLVKKFEYKSFPVLPGVPRVEVFRLDEPLPAGQYLVRAVVDVGLKERLAAETRVTVAGS
jgi:P pilus assembly chaperone PapD